MRRIALVAAAGFVLAASGAHAAKKFEGTVLYKVEAGEGQAGHILMAQRGNKMRSEMARENGQMAVAIFDLANGDMTMLIPQQKAYMTLNLREMGKQHQEDAKAVDITPLGKKETIAGIPCDVFLILSKQDGSSVETCAAKGMGTLGMPQQPGGGASTMSVFSESNPNFAKYAKDGFFPLRLTVKNGQPMNWVAEKVDRTPPDPSLFVPPPGFKKMDVPPGAIPGMPPQGAPPRGAPQPGAKPEGAPPPAPK